MREYVRPGDTVLLKVNLLAPMPPEKSITTHPALVEAVSREVTKAGGKVLVGDSPAGIPRGVERFWEITGIGEAVERTRGMMVKFEGSGTRSHREGGRIYHLSAVLDHVDVVINMPKLKTHGLTLFTGAVKNCFGLIPGYQKTNFHKKAPKVEPFSEILVDIFSLAKPHLHIMDAVIGLEGNGPSANGSPRKIGLILASGDGVSLDSVAARIIGFGEGRIATTRIAAERGLGEGRLSHIQIEGPPLSGIAVPGYALPTHYFLNLVPTWLVKFAERYVWVRPKADPVECTRCGVCIESCPVQCISPGDGGIPTIDYSACINCLSCDESCPHGAMIQEMSWLARRIH
jgi:uncharacterized protein (DUF362 family)/Pyruvate/2-oxoacid:ferredoxin oxidoreductase delta subunit